MREDLLTGFRDVSDDYISVGIAACWVDDGDGRPPPARSSSTNMDPTAPSPPTTVAVPDDAVMAGSTRRTRGPARTPRRAHGAAWTP